LLEAQAWPGPSIVIAYSTCIAHGIEMSTSMTHQKDAVSSGYWPLYRYRPSEDEHTKPFHLDSKAPTTRVKDFMMAETRFSMLTRANPERAAHLMAMAQADADEKWSYYSQIAGVERSMPHETPDEPDTDESVEEQS
jgi:pyruvate-ferredoxin/flavodoxin oxidoreductase